MALISSNAALRPGLHAEPERGGRPFEHGGLAERDGVGGDAVLGECRNGKGREGDGCGKRAAQHEVHGIPQALATVRRLRKMRVPSKGMLNDW